MPGIFPDTVNGGIVYRDEDGDCLSPPGVLNAYCPSASFITTCQITAFPSDCTARVSPAQMNAIVSELLCLAETWTPDGEWDCGNFCNLSTAFNVFFSSFPAAFISGDEPNLLTTGTDGGLLVPPVPVVLQAPTRTIVTATGAGTYNTPVGCIAILVQLQAAGGGGGYSNPNTSQAAVGGGGGGGAYSEKLIVSPAASYSYNLGAPGAGGVAPSTAATAGAASNFGIELACNGGAAGGSSSSTTILGGSAAGGDGGTVTIAGDFVQNGGNGGSGIVFSGSICFGGDGGDAHMGIVMKGRGTGNPGTTGRGRGSGGTGASNTNLSVASGGDGAGPILIVTEYYN